MAIELVPPSVWEPELTLASAGSPPHARLTSAVLWTLQDAHVGITPALAGQMAAVLTSPKTVRGSAWARVVQGLHDTVSDSCTTPTGLNPSANSMYFLLSVARPLICDALGRTGRSLLLCRDERPSAVTPEAYRRYGADLERELTRPAGRDGSARFPALEREGIVMSTLSALRAREKGRSRMPEMDRLTAALLFAMPSAVSGDRWLPRQAPRPTVVPRTRPSPGPNEGSIEGIRHSRREADFGARTLSEYLLPSELQLERMIDSGFFIHERRPLREKLRDVLVVGIMPGGLRQTPAGAFIKACWADCMARLGHRLVTARLRETEFRWIEADAADEARRTSFLLQRLPRGADAEPRHERFRKEFFRTLGWLPAFLDGHSDRGVPIDAAAPHEWVSAAWRAQTDDLGWPRHASSGESPADRFSFVHAVVCLSADEFRRIADAAIGGARRKTGRAEQSDEAAAARVLGLLRARLRLGRRRRHVSMVIAPKTPMVAGWVVGTSVDPYRRLRSLPNQPALTTTASGQAHLASELQGAWLDALTQEVWHD